MALLLNGESAERRFQQMGEGSCMCMHASLFMLLMAMFLINIIGNGFRSHLREGTFKM